MADDSRWKDSFRSWSDRDRFAHPDSPSGGGGPGGFHQAGPLGTGDDWSLFSGVPHPRSHAARYLTSTDWTESLDPVTKIWRIIDATSWEALKSLAENMFDPHSFVVGFFYGVAEGGWGTIHGLLDLGKMILGEGIYEVIHSLDSRSGSFWQDIKHVGNAFVHVVAGDVIGGLEDLAKEGAHILAKAPLLSSHLDKYHGEFQQLMDELSAVVSDPRAFFGKFWEGEVKQYSQKWQRFTKLMKNPSMSNSFAAGRIAGQTALEVVLLLATFIDGVGLPLKGAKALGDLPKLLGTFAKRVSVKDAKATLKRLRPGHGTPGEPKAPKLERPPTEPSPPPKGDVPSYAGKLRGETVNLPGVETKEITYTKRTPADLATLRAAFDSNGRASFVKYLGSNPDRIAELRHAGFTGDQIAAMRDYGKVPSGWNVHHKLPLDDGGTNDFSNLVLIENEPYHKVITAAQKALTGGLSPGETKTIDFPVPSGYVYPPSPQ